MKFDVAGFTQKAPGKVLNQDRILVQDLLLEKGAGAVSGLDSCRCFVADGMGSTAGSEAAAHFVLDAIRLRVAPPPASTREELGRALEVLNDDLIAINQASAERRGAATTVVGLFLWQGGLQLVSAGDSEAWAARGDLFFRINAPQVFNELAQNSPVTSYFGGASPSLKLELATSLREVREHDRLLLCSDGLFKALPSKEVSEILRSNRGAQEMVAALQGRVAESAAPDDVSCIVIEVTE